MSMMISSLKRRNEALQNECDSLAGGIDHLSNQLQEAYQLLQKYEPAYVAEKMGVPVLQPAPGRRLTAAEAEEIGKLQDGQV
ncbi:hypothetical protein M0654_03765 [Rhizobium sp. NTR19]|uniref:Uncharacterized protein n=1 Tax=Neorhizobium turbinariae TaxID=2937795 RepID=A0ABT0IMJ2_9HYPH|nr:hypothetical protein [Neorhizobium turbinariae]MCK8779097.1 hypothetical protein [Neorhizobium turbinariae]